MVNKPLLGGIAVVYICIALQYALEGRYGMTVVFVAYALANFGFVLDMTP